jgi:hypothetical protein
MFTVGGNCWGYPRGSQWGRQAVGVIFARIFKGITRRGLAEVWLRCGYALTCACRAAYAHDPPIPSYFSSRASSTIRARQSSPRPRLRYAQELGNLCHGPTVRQAVPEIDQVHLGLRLAFAEIGLAVLHNCS